MGRDTGPVEVPLLYEDDHVVAVDKPALLPVHPTARYHHNTLIKVLKAARPEAEFLSLGHRLDRETSGVLLVSKTRAFDRALKRRLEARDGVEKSYVAITWGVPDRGDGATTFRYERNMELDEENPLRVKMRPSDAPDALYAATRFHVEELRRSAGGRLYARVRCDLGDGAATPDSGAPGALWGRPSSATSSTDPTSASSRAPQTVS